MKARILVLVFTYAPNVDGVANAAGLVAEGLAVRGHEVSVATLWHPQRKSPGASDNPKVFQFRVGGSAHWRDPLRGETSAFRQFVMGFKGDVILCHCLDTAPVQLALPEFRRIKAAKALISHGFEAHRLVLQPGFPWGLPTWLGWQPFVSRLPCTLRKFERLVFLSPRRDFGRFFDQKVASAIGHKGLRVIPNGVDWKTTEFNLPDFRLAYGLQHPLMFLCVAYYCDGKNQLSALRAYRQARIPNSALVFIGTERNDYSRAMEQLDAQMAPEFPEGRVLVLDKLGRAMTEAAFRTMDIFLFPTKAETQPLVLIESMAAGKPFISMDRGCISDFAGGTVVQTEPEMVKEIQRLALNADLRAKLGAQGRRDFLAKYTKQSVVDAYEEVITELVERSGGCRNFARRNPPET